MADNLLPLTAKALSTKVLYSLIGILCLTGVGWVSSRFISQSAPNAPLPQISQNALKAPTPQAAPEQNDPLTQPTLATLAHHKPPTTAEPDFQTVSKDITLPADDGSHYVQAISIPYTVWDSTHQTIAVYITPQFPQYTQEIKQAFIAWQQALNGMFSFTFVSSPDGSDCVITWADTLAQDALHSDSTYTAGVTESLQNNMFIFQNDMVFRVKQPNQQPIIPTDMYNTAVHEIGHMLGIKGHSANPADVMSAIASANPGRHPITQRDVNTLQYLYKNMVDAPRILTPPHVTLAAFRRSNLLVKDAFTLEARRQLPEALVKLKEASALFSANPEAQLLLANIYLQQNQFSQAKQTLQPWINQEHTLQKIMYSKWVIAHIMQARAYALDNQTENARDEARLALPKLSHALEIPQLDNGVKAYLQKSESLMTELADLPG